MMGMASAAVPGMEKLEIDTPALLIDVEGMEANIAAMAGFFARVPANLRPHFKTHKSPVLAHKQIAAGAIGITCAKLGEAEILVNTGIESILIANQIVGATKVSRLAGLARHAHLIVAVDNPENVRQLSKAAVRAGSTLHVVVEVDVGMARCGVPPGQEAVELARLVTQSPGLVFSGLLGYEGHAVMIGDGPQRQEIAQRAMAALTGAAGLIRRAGMEVEIVSAGGTGTYDQTGQYPGVTEVEAGSYILMDCRYREVGVPFRCALTLLATVISVPAPDRAVIDAGKKALTQEFGLPQVTGCPGVRLVSLSEEHGVLAVDPEQAELRIADKIELIPSHVCTTVNLHDWYFAIRDNRLEAIWPIAARGKVQ